MEYKEFAKDSFRQEKCIEEYDLYKSGSKSESEWKTYVYYAIKDYIVSVAYKTGRAQIAFSKSIDMYDLIDESMCEVYSHLDSFDPHIGTLTSFFDKFINAAQVNVFEKHKTISEKYVSTNAQALNRIARELGYEGYDDPNLSPVALSKISGKSAATIRNVRENYGRQICSIDKENEDGDSLLNTISSSFNPEDWVIKQERAEYVKEALMSLEPFERWLFLANVEENMSMKMIVSACKQPGFLDQFGMSPVGLDGNELTRRLNNICSKLRHYKKFKKDNSSFKFEDDDFEQGDANDIFDGFQDLGDINMQ